MAGPKLSIEDQIADMQKKGITFEKVGIPEAKRFLRENNYYFKLKAPYNVRLHKNKDILFQVSRIKAISEKSRKTWMQNPVVHDFIILVFMPGGARPSLQSFRPPSAQTMMNAPSGRIAILLNVPFGCLWLYTGQRYRHTTEHVITSGDPETEYL